MDRGFLKRHGRAYKKIPEAVAALCQSVNMKPVLCLDHQFYLASADGICICDCEGGRITHKDFQPWAVLDMVRELWQEQ